MGFCHTLCLLDECHLLSFSSNSLPHLINPNASKLKNLNCLQILQLDIVQQEYIHEYGLNQTELVKAAFDAKGKWLATVEQRKDVGSDLELHLKLWAFDERTQRYSRLRSADTLDKVVVRCSDVISKQQCILIL